MKVNFTVKAVSTKNPGKYAICSMDDQWYSSFGTCPVKKGDQVSVEYVQNGDFKNITEIKILNIPTGVVEVHERFITTPSLDKDRLIVRQSCLKAAVELACNKIYSVDTVDKAKKILEQLEAVPEKIHVLSNELITEMAEEFENWVFR